MIRICTPLVIALFVLAVNACPRASAQTVIVDNEDAGFSILAGDWETGEYGTPYGSYYHWHGTTGAGYGYALAEWRPTIPTDGEYTVSVWYVPGGNRSTNAPFTIHHGTGSSTTYINQQQYGESWVSLGTHFFYAGTAGHVVLDTDAGPTVVIADAIRFERIAESEPEFRGFWADAFHSGFKSYSQVDTMIARAVQGNYNAILPEVLAYQDNVGGGHGAYWNSSIVPKASDISPSFDPLAYMVSQAHAAGLEVHVWLVPFRTCTSWPPSGNATLSAHPEWISVTRSAMGGGPSDIGGAYHLDPGSPGAQEYLMSIVRELLEYDIDGVHWDYIRMLQQDAGYPAYTSYDESGLARFKRITGYAGTPSTDNEDWSDFRRREITEVVRRAQTIVATTDHPRQPLRHSAALITWGNAPSNFHFSSAYGIFQDWEDWLYNGYLDTGVMMAYYNEDQYPTWYRNWVDSGVAWSHSRQMVVGPGIYLNSFSDSTNQIEYAQTAGADGICTYSYAVTVDSGDDTAWYPHAAATVFTQPAETPHMPWRDPATATRGAIYGRVVDGLTGEPIDNANMRFGSISYARTDANGFYVMTRLPASAGGDTHAITAEVPGFSSVTRPLVLLEPAGYTEANFSMGQWQFGDADVDGDVDLEDRDRFDMALTGPDLGPPPAGGDVFDSDLDNDVDTKDLASFQASFGQ